MPTPLKRILCPTDFSPASINATEYAARLARRTGATVTLLHVQQVYLSEGVELFSGEEAQMVRAVKDAGAQLAATCAEITGTFGVACRHEVMASVTAFERKVAGEAERHDLAVVGTNGADTAFQFYFGSHSYRIAKQAETPVLIVPEECPYADPGVVLFACDHRRGDALAADQLKTFVAAVNARLAAVHVSDQGPERAQADYDAFREAAPGALDGLPLLAEERLVTNEPTSALFDQVRNLRADVLALNLLPHGLLYRLTHPNVVKRIAGEAICPVLIFHR
jgi:nucleotide-binding universal stress UspA family protein